MEFSRDVDFGTAVPANFVLTEIGGDTIGGSISGHDATVVFQPEVSLKPLTKYNMLVQAGVKDVFGSPLSRALSWYFSTKGENLLPLAIGDTWVYHVSISRDYPTPYHTSYIDSIVIVRDTTIGDKQFYVDSKRRLYRCAGDTIEATAYLYNDKPQLVNDDCESGLVDTVETVVGTFVSQHFYLSYYGEWDRYTYIYDFYFAPDVGLTHLGREVRMPCSGCIEYTTWRLLSYELH